MHNLSFIFLSLFVFVVCLSTVQGHGRLVEPPSRSSMWRFGFNTPPNHRGPFLSVTCPCAPNYNDNELFCGGFQRQWGVNAGKCGVCGDPWDGERQNEAGGQYATGVIARDYQQGEIITIAIDLTANHLGYFEFRLCPHNSPDTPVTQQCLDEHLLTLKDGGHRHHVTTARKGIYSIEVELPSDVTCSQCVIQWKYNTGNSWGCAGSECCVGCGPQEQFYGCADVSISSSYVKTATPASTTTKKTPHSTSSSSQPMTSSTTTRQPITTTVRSERSTDSSSKQPTTNVVTGKPTNEDSSTTRSTTVKVPETTKITTTLQPTTTPTGETIQCKSAGAWEGNPRVTVWCKANCALGFCPAEFCSDSCRLLSSVQY